MSTINIPIWRRGRRERLRDPFHLVLSKEIKFVFSSSGFNSGALNPQQRSERSPVVKSHRYHGLMNSTRMF